MRHVILATVVCVAAFSLINYAEAQTYTGVLRFDSINSEIRTGSTVIFSGQLGTTSGHVVQGATIYIKDDVSFGPDYTIVRLTTDDAGRFYGTWTAQPRGDGAWDFYAVYEGSSNIKKARSTTHSVYVSSYYSTHVILDRIPSSVYAGDSVTFTGKVTANGQPLRNAYVKILEDDPLKSDQRLGAGRTDSDGRFSITWKVTAGLVEDDFDVYAVFDGHSAYKRDRTPNQVMTVLKYDGFITLNEFPTRVRAGDVVTFSGTLSLDSHSSESAVVYIKDEDPFTGDELLATGYVDNYGRFSASWFADYVDEDPVVDVYAVFEGNDIFYRLTTCDPGPTRSFGGACGNTMPLRVYGSLPTTPSNYVPEDDQYMELYYSLDFHRAPHVAIVTSPDSYDEVRSHITPVKEGIMMWESELARLHGGDWDVTFEVVNLGDPFFDSRPDVIVNLVTHDEHSPCFTDYYGIARVNGIKPIQTVVCSTSGGEKRSYAGVAATAAHEFIHALGLGHTFNKARDMMCSVEEDYGPTCDGLSSKSKSPSSLNLAAVVKLYGTDGYTDPNNLIKRGDRFALGDSDNTDNSKPPDQRTVPTKPSADCPRDHYTYDKTINKDLKSGWYTWYILCSNTPVSYSFSTDNKYHGFKIYVLPPNTDVKNFMNHDEGEYYTCEEYGKEWHRKSNTCNVESGSKIVLYNTMQDTIKISGWIKN